MRISALRARLQRPRFIRYTTPRPITASNRPRLPSVAAALAILALLSFPYAVQAQTGDFYSTISQLIASSPCARAAGTSHALTPDRRLEQAAALLAGGSALADSLSTSGYHARHSAYITVANVPAEALPSELVRGYCAELLKNSAIGIYASGRKFWVVLALPVAPAVIAPQDAAAQEVLALVNRARAQPRRCGNTGFASAPPLRWSDSLAQAANAHAVDMAGHNHFSHDGTDGSDVMQRVTRTGYIPWTVGENIAAGQATARDVVAQWLNSPAHCSNIMDPDYADFGVAYVIDAASMQGIYWAQVFATPRPEAGPLP